MTTQSLEAQLAAKIRWAWHEGCPIAGGSEKMWAEIAATARRRWFSFERRCSENTEDHRTNRVEDLARGLCEKYERGGLHMAGPLISDYRWLAEQLADILMSESQ